MGDFINWLFNDRTGVICLVVGGILIMLAIAIVLERKTRKVYYNHEKTEDDFDLFDDEEDSESGWSDFDEDNK